MSWEVEKMEFRTRICNPTLFRKTLSRFWPIWAAYFGVWVLVLPLTLSGELTWMVRNPPWTARLSYVLLSAGSETGVLISLAFGLLGAMAAFGHLYASRSAYMMAAIPVKRRAVFLAQFMAPLCAFWGIDVLVFLITLAVELSAGVVDVSATAQWLAMTAMLNLFFYGFGCLCAQLTGNALALPVVYLVASFAVAGLEMVIRGLAADFAYGMMHTGGLSLGFLSPAAYLLENSGLESIQGAVFSPATGSYITDTVEYYYSGWLGLGLYAAAGVLCVVAAAILYQRRDGGGRGCDCPGLAAACI